MYTSGCPKIQNRCCHNSGSAPADTVKNVASNVRWNISRNSATVITGMANNNRNWMTRIIHVNTGMRISDMPLVRMLRAVTMRLIGTRQRGDAGDQQAEHPEVDAVATARTARWSSAST